MKLTHSASPMLPARLVVLARLIVLSLTQFCPSPSPAELPARWRNWRPTMLYLGCTGATYGFEASSGATVRLVPRNSIPPTVRVAYRVVLPRARRTNATRLSVLLGEHDVAAHNLVLRSFELAADDGDVTLVDVRFEVDAEGLLRASVRASARPCRRTLLEPTLVGGPAIDVDAQECLLRNTEQGMPWNHASCGGSATPSAKSRPAGLLGS